MVFVAPISELLEFKRALHLTLQSVMQMVGVSSSWRRSFSSVFHWCCTNAWTWFAGAAVSVRLL